MSDCTCERDYFMVVGLIVSKNYQQSKYIVEVLNIINILQLQFFYSKIIIKLNKRF